jgi:predicted PurR-regulated permease PerM
MMLGDPPRESLPRVAGIESFFAPPRWLRDLGRSSWLLVGALLVLLGLIWLLGATYTIVGPVLAATIVAVVTLPLADRLDRHMPRAAASALVLVLLAALAVGVLLLVLNGIVDQRDAISAHTSAGVDKLQSYLTDAGTSSSTAESVGSAAKTDGHTAVTTLLQGIGPLIRGITSFVLGLSFAGLTLFFVLKDGPRMQRWIDDHAGAPVDVVHTITSGLGRALRGYFRGVTIVAAFNGVVVGGAAWLLGVPLAGAIGVVSFITAYIPYIGAVIAGTFAVLIALGAKGTTIAIAMLLIFLLANGLLQNIVQPFAMGASLDLHPLVVLVTTIAAGCLFGTIGLVLAGPLLSAAVHIPRELRQLTASGP